ncbi:MAG: dethiobiotin synthase [Gammaproteobacteria bacterium]|nr:dethiobiotin synthase [Chromatiales bacterium]MCP4925103.1 dethiobiotin synthase [Gammaproteobacteria bacterium]MDP7154711.1 dethiobiotin synthase [Gammaproteobacteria bacterium]MDP7297014.1 dethiobiotin synthase [Gammaproteobacteria bacterium]MDP7418685.1 dethiobiotin synthase [Gammaproteobacteria bacterium]
MTKLQPAEGRLNGYFITGTDTGVGKTLVAAGLLVAANRQGLATVGIKPVAAGCCTAETACGATLINADALALQSAASIAIDYNQVNPIALQPPIAPHIAAADSGVLISAGKLVQHCRRVTADSQAQFVIVEGAGGWLVPLNQTETMADFCVGLGFPVIIVVGMQLGCLNHTLLTVQAVRAAGLPIAGWVANCIEPEMAALAGNLQSLQALLSLPALGVVPYLGMTATADQAAKYLQFDLLTRVGK